MWTDIKRFAEGHGCIVGVYENVIVLGKGYTPSPYRNLSSLGYGKDYHITLTDILKKLAAHLNCNGTIQVDSGKVLERELAVQAGLGFLGRNGLVISSKLGSFFNIGLLIADVNLAGPTNCSPNVTSCPEDCKICIKACPVKAINSHGVDYKACISYITQKKGVEAMHTSGQLYGCDLCQICCPFNKIKPPTSTIKPEEILVMDNEVFMARFGHTALSWRGLKHLQRNALACLKNTK